MPSPFKISPEFIKAFGDGIPPSKPDAEFLNHFGVSQAITISGWIKQVGPNAFVEMILAFTEAAGGRPKTDYSVYIAEFHRIKQSNPALGDDAIAGQVARAAFKRNDWGAFNPPDSPKSMASTIKRQATARRGETKSASKPADAEGARAAAIKTRVQKRAAALSDVAMRFVALGDQIDNLQATVQHLCTSDGVAEFQQDLEATRAPDGSYPMVSAILVSLLGATKPDR
jgi:hypothetical protein